MMKTLYTFLISLLLAVPAFSSPSVMSERVPDGLPFMEAVSRSKAKPSRADESEYLFKDVTLTAAGTLAEALGEDAKLVDSLVVRGPINEVDFKTMWSASFHDNLEVIDLGNAEIENNIVPECAFWDAKAQTYDNYIIPIHLRKIILPEGITEIGTRAFFYASALDEVRLPSSLVKIDNLAFTYCQKLTAQSFVFPENLEVIGNSAFACCYKLAGEVVLPEKLKILEKQAFYQCAITNISFPSTLEFLGKWAFAGNRLIEAYLPDNCTLDSGGCQFLGNFFLERVHLPAITTAIPEATFESCASLNDINFPSSLVSIGADAFYDCQSLKSANLPEGLETIEKGGFAACTGLEEIMLPASLKTIGDRAFADTKPKKIYSKAVTAPMCTPTSFQGVSNKTPLYIPVGSRNDYVSTQNYWYNFINIIETDDFPSLSVSGIEVDGGDEADAPVYDLMGRSVDSPQPGQIYIRAGKKFTVKP